MGRSFHAHGWKMDAEIGHEGCLLVTGSIGCGGTGSRCRAGCTVVGSLMPRRFTAGADRAAATRPGCRHGLQPDARLPVVPARPPGAWHRLSRNGGRQRSSGAARSAPISPASQMAAASCRSSQMRTRPRRRRDGRRRPGGTTVLQAQRSPSCSARAGLDGGADERRVAPGCCQPRCSRHAQRRQADDCRRCGQPQPNALWPLLDGDAHAGEAARSGGDGQRSPGRRRIQQIEMERAANGRSCVWRRRPSQVISRPKLVLQCVVDGQRGVCRSRRASSMVAGVRCATSVQAWSRLYQMGAACAKPGEE